VARSRLERAEESLAFTRRRAEVGTGTRSDTLRARLEVQNARQAVLVNESSLRAARLNLGRQIGVQGPVAAILPEGIEPSPLPLSEEEMLRWPRMPPHP
jgi:outer membrane protein